MENEVEKTAMRRLINANDIRAHALSRGQMKRYQMARHAEMILSPEVDREVSAELYHGMRPEVTSIAQQAAA